MIIFLASCNSYQRQLMSYPPHCQQLLLELKYRIIKNDTGGYTFRFEHPVSDTIPLSETPRDLEYQNFCKTVLYNDSLCKCGFDSKLIVKTIGQPNKLYPFGIEQNLFVTNYILDFGFNCGGNKCPGSESNECNVMRFRYDHKGFLISYSGISNTFDIEPYYCPTNAREYYLKHKKK